MKKSIISCLSELFQPIPELPSPSLKDKTIMIIGANIGLGFETAKHLARLNPSRLILGCRDKIKCDDTVKRIRKEVEEFDGIVEGWEVDLAEFESVKLFIERINMGGGGVPLNRLDLLVLNAGVAQHTDLKYIPARDGFEHALQINNISQSWIALRCLPLMNETAEIFHVKPRVVVVGSEVHYWADIPDKVLSSSNAWKVLGSEEYCSSLRVLLFRYNVTKLLNTFFVRALNSHLKSPNIIVTCVNPGLCYSGLRRNMTGIVGAFLSIYERIFARQTEDGGKLIAWACIGAEGEEESLKGAYVNLSRVEEPSDFVLGEKGKKREDKLWNDLLDLLMDMDEFYLKDALSACVHLTA